MLKRSFVISLSTLSIMFCIKPVSAQNTYFAPNVGLQRAFGEGSAFSTVGFTVAANLFYSFSNNLAIGGRMAFNRLLPDGQMLLELSGPSSEYKLESTSGGYSIIEIVPSIQIAPSMLGINRDTNLAFQFGAGLYIVKFDASATGRISSQETFGIGVKSSWEKKPGVQAGLAIGIKRRLLIQPLFSFIFIDGSANDGFFAGHITKYYSLNVGFLLSK